MSSNGKQIITKVAGVLGIIAVAATISGGLAHAFISDPLDSRIKEHEKRITKLENAAEAQAQNTQEIKLMLYEIRGDIKTINVQLKHGN